MLRRKVWYFLWIFSAFLLMTTSALGQVVATAPTTVPHLVNFSGAALDTQGQPRGGVVGITFTLYKDEHGGASLWLETQNVQLDENGHFSVYLGATKPGGVPPELFISGEAHWLGVQVEGQAEQPRVLLVSAPYALKAADAETIGGLPPSAFVLAAPSTNAATTASTGSTPNPTTGTLSVVPAGTVNFVPIFTDNSGTLGNSALFQAGTGATAKVGINTTTPASTLDVKGGSTVRGILQLPSVGTATATAGSNSNVVDLVASSFNSSTAKAVNQTFQWQAEPTGNNSAAPSGTLNLMFGSGTKPAETGLKISSKGLFTFATGQTFPGAGTISGVTAGTGLTGGGSTGSVTLNLDTTQIPQLNVANTFTGNQTVSGNLTATGAVTGNTFQIGSNLFAFGSYTNSNAFLGFGGNTITTGSSNTATGVQALSQNGSGSQNTALGSSALLSNTSGSSNTAVGNGALNLNSTGANNTASGTVALQANTTGSYNTANGIFSLFNNTTGGFNTALGYLSGPDSAHSNLNNSSAIGAMATVTASNSLVLGSIAGVNGSGSNTNVGIGTTAPQFTLDVHGTGNFTGPIIFASSQTFPNTVSGVTAGTGLTGGGTTGNVTLNLDTTKVPQLNVSNTFVGDQTVSGNLNSTGLMTGSGYQIGSNLFAFGSYANSNAFLGFSGNTTTTGTSNTANGYLALSSVTSGGANTANGWESLSSNTTGTANTASGVSALLSNTTGSFNMADGQLALFLNTTGASNTASGSDALPHNTTGSYNTASGSTALYSSTSGNGNTAIGDAALFNNNTGSNNTALGYLAGPADVFHANLSNATAIGANAEVDQSNTMVLGSINGLNGATADTLVGIGTTTPAAKLDVHGTANFTGLITFAAGQAFPGAGTIFGVTAGTGMTGGGTSGNVTLNVDTTKVVTGVTAGAGLTGGGTGGVQTLNIDTTKVPQLSAANTFTNNQTVSGNLTATGVVSGSSYQIGSTLFGFGSLSTGNVFFGFSGNTTTTGMGNTATGFEALLANTSGVNNTASGFGALTLNTTGSENLAAGTYALQHNTTGTQNTASGMSALTNSTTGSQNTAVGAYSLEQNSGSSNTGLGFGTAVTSNSSNSTAIGTNALVSESNALVLGSINGLNGATADTLVGIGISAPAYKLHVGVFNGNSLRVEGPGGSLTGSMAGSFGGYGDFGIDAPGVVSGRLVVKESGNVGVGVSSPTHIFQVAQGKGAAFADSWSTYSSRRWKTNIQTLPDALAKVEQLRGVSYDLKGSSKHEIGVIAEEVGQIVPEVVSYAENGKDAQGVDYSRLTALLIEAVKQQQQQIARLNNKVTALQAALRTTGRAGKSSAVFHSSNPNLHVSSAGTSCTRTGGP